MAHNSPASQVEGSALPRIFGRYVLLKALGRGAMGHVHLARPLNRKRGVPSPVVLKRLRKELAEKEAFVARFRHEAVIAVSVTSSNVAKVYDVGSVGPSLYIVMEYIRGWPLSSVLDSILQSRRHASIASVLDVVVGGLRGLHALHTAADKKSGRPLGIVHRDLSPKNLMVGEDGELRLIDLGLGKSNVQEWKTRTGVVMGSIGYMAPEQARGEHVDQRADIYAMGVVTYEMLALRNYIKRGSATQMMESTLNPRFVRPSEFRPDVPAGLDDVLRTALATKPEDRFPTAMAFLRALEKIVPHSQTRGGMASLLDELFGPTKGARTKELEQLLALPDPESDAFDTMPTRVFALGAGVSSDEETVVRTAATEVNRLGSEVPAVRVRPVWPDPASIKPPRPVPRTVSVSVFAGAVVVAALLGGLLALTAQRWFTFEAPTATVPAATPSVAQQPSAQPRSPTPVDGPTDSVDPSADLQPVREPPVPPASSVRPRSPARERLRARSQPARPPPMATLNAALDRLAQQVDVRRNTADGERRRDLTALMVAIRQARASQDASRKQASLQRLQQQLQRLDH